MGLHGFTWIYQKPFKIHQNHPTSIKQPFKIHPKFIKTQPKSIKQPFNIYPESTIHQKPTKLHQQPFNIYQNPSKAMQNPSNSKRSKRSKSSNSSKIYIYIFNTDTFLCMYIYISIHIYIYIHIHIYICCIYICTYQLGCVLALLSVVVDCCYDKIPFLQNKNLYYTYIARNIYVYSIYMYIYIQ